jgi:tetratricopeptide (TPR) repeat protein
MHFKSLPEVDEKNVSSLEDLTSTIELYNTLIGLGRYDDAQRLFSERLDDATLYHLSASSQRVELLEMLFPDGLDQIPRLSKPGDQAYTLNALAQGYLFSGQPGRGLPLYRMHNSIQDRECHRRNLAIGLGNLSESLKNCGALSESEAAARRALAIIRELSAEFIEAISLYHLGLTLAARGAASQAEASLQRSLRIKVAQAEKESVVTNYLAQRALWLGEGGATRGLANRAWNLARAERLERQFICAARLQGAAALALDDLATADERLHHALSRARAVNYVEEELPALAALAESRRKQGNLKAARELLDDVWGLAERGPYPLLHADALNVLAQIERDAGNRAAAVATATKAYRLAWCDGPPFAYHWGLEAARAHLKALGAPEPTDLPPYDESKYEPMPEVEINPPDEFGDTAG